jgi:hypothetical protein
MNHHLTTAWSCTLALLVGGLLSGVATGQTGAASRRNAAGEKTGVPRLPDGRPDLQGVWSFESATPLQRPPEFANKPVLTDAETEAFLKTIPSGGCRYVKCDGSAEGRLESAYDDTWYAHGSKLADNRTSLVVDPPDGRVPPLTADAQKKVAEVRALDRGRAALDGPEQATLTDRCIIGFNSGPPMNPSAYNNNVQIAQTASHVVIFNEMIHSARIVPLDGRPHLSAGVRLWVGDSRGHWEGDTLVVETTNFRRDSQVGPGGSTSVAPERVRLVERFTRTGPDRLQYEYTLNDPQTWTKPWTARIPMTISSNRIYEYACHEGNYSMANRLSAARAAEGSARNRKKD